MAITDQQKYGGGDAFWEEDQRKRQRSAYPHIATPDPFTSPIQHMQET